MIAFSETWLNQSISTDDLKFGSFSEPERKDRLHDSHDVYCYMSKIIYVINADVI